MWVLSHTWVSSAAAWSTSSTRLIALLDEVGGLEHMSPTSACKIPSIRPERPLGSSPALRRWMQAGLWDVMLGALNEVGTGHDSVQLIDSTTGFANPRRFALAARSGPAPAACRGVGVEVTWDLAHFDRPPGPIADAIGMARAAEPSIPTGQLSLPL